MMNPTFQEAYDAVQLLVEKFKANNEHYMRSTYSEAEARQDFIDKFFNALGWDVTHTYQHDPYKQDVKIEKSQKQQNETGRKRADYAFYNAPNYKDVHFFVEAKKPYELLKNNPIHYFQTIKYGWNAGCPISVLTDFEEFVIIDCRAKPNLKFALNGIHKSYRYTDYADEEKFAEIFYLFGRQAVAEKSIENYVTQMPKAKGKVTQSQLFKGGYQAIDDSFLEYIDGIRETIAKAFKKSNPDLDSEMLTEATQRTIDRLVFIRFLEDKLIEPVNHINEWAAHANSWQAFISDCRALNVKYNGVVFKPLFIDNPNFLGADEKLFGDICHDLSSDNSPYDFNYIPIHILGSIYERFLGKVVVATAKQVRLEEKPEVRKAGGVYYTPKYIVDYIVANTVGKLIAGKTPDKIAEMTFADIACGSGSFLIGVYDYLLQYHKEYYQRYPTRAKADGCIEVEGVQTLSIHQKQDILLNNIYGVDIDSQAVEVTQLSLFLKMLEDETLSSTMAQAKQTSLYTKVLPDLTKNIVCGNSLIGTDILTGQLFSTEEERKLNPMDYNTTFPKVFKKGGFDAVVGNPPYGQLINSYINEKYYNHISIVSNSIDYYLTFILKAIKIVKADNPISFIVPTTWIYMNQFDSFKKYLADKTFINEIVYFKKSVFKDATVETLIFNLYNRKFLKTDQFNFKIIEGEPEQFIFDSETILYRDLLTLDSFVLSKKNIHDLFIKIKTNTLELKEIAIVVCGLTPYRLGKGNPIQTKHIVDGRIYDSKVKVNEEYKQYIMGRDFYRYSWIINDERFIKYGDCLAEPRYKAPFFENKIVVRQTADKIIANYDTNKYLSLKNVHNIKIIDSNYNDLFVLGLLNSKLITWWYQKLIPENGRVFAEVKVVNLNKIPFVRIVKNNISIHNNVVSLVDQMLDSKAKLQEAVLEKDITYYQNKCTRLDAQIDSLVYELYGLTDEEIRIVEGE